MGGKFRVLVTDPIDAEGLKVLRDHPGIELLSALKPSPEDLRSLLQDGVNAWLVRSETKITAESIESARALRLIGRAGVGVDNIDVDSATRRGIAVINAPQASTIAACEHAFAMILSLSRLIPQADADMKAGRWDRAKWMGTELAGKTLGIVGFGRIGRELAKRAAAFGMKLLAHDPYVPVEQARGTGVELVALEQLFKSADFITLHCPLTDATRKLVNRSSLGWVKPGSRLVNCARGELVDGEALAEAVKSGRLRGAALDVFEAEPLSPSSPLRGLPQVVLTPHLGASTEEAQRKVAEELSRGVLEFYEKGLARHAINLPGFDPDTLERLRPYLALSDALGRFLGQMLDSGLKEVRCEFHGEFGVEERHPLAVSALKGVLSHILGEGVGFINAPLLARERGITTHEVAQMGLGPAGFAKLLVLAAVTDSGATKVAGTIFSDGEPRIVRLDELYVEFKPEGRMIILTNSDTPGMIGKVGSLLGRHGINIGDMRVGRRSPHGEAVMVLTVDDDASPAVLGELKATPGVTGVRWVKL